MLGTELEPGVVALTLEELFQHIQNNQQHAVYRVTMSYLEVSSSDEVEETIHPLSPPFSFLSLLSSLSPSLPLLTGLQ